MKEKKTELGYKVLSRFDDGLYSFNLDRTWRSDYEKSYLSLPYSTQYWTMAEEPLYSYGFHLTFFLTFDFAKSFYFFYSSENTEIWSVEGRGTHAPTRLRKETYCISDIDRWAGGGFLPWPEGTMMAKAIRLGEKVR